MITHPNSTTGAHDGDTKDDTSSAHHLTSLHDEQEVKRALTILEGDMLDITNTYLNSVDNWLPISPVLFSYR